MNSKQVRQIFLDYFKKHGHQVVASSSLIPAEDPTLLFTNAGMNQFKDLLLGVEKRSYTTATSSQKCVRAGGKHNDLVNVGFTARHLTFFEMLGNFSFGDYFKKEAIEFAWNLLINELGFPEDKMYISIYNDDDEAYELWQSTVGLPKERIVRLGEKDNFWQMGDTGPCGPCTELHIDLGPEYGCNEPDCAVGCDCGRYFEVWNLVFMQYNKDESGTLNPLKQTGIDTGMGLERLCMVLQNKKNVFHTDLFDAPRNAITKETGIDYWSANDQTQAAFNVICDHVRSSCLLIADGCSPANDGRGYVLRKIIRRAILFAQKLSDNDALMTITAQAFIADMSETFPELKTNESLILSVLTHEIERFSANLVNGQAILEKYLAQPDVQASQEISGEQAFKLYDTYGFPLELTKVIAHDKNLKLDEDGFNTCMAQQKEQSKKSDQFSAAQSAVTFPEDLVTQFKGYELTELTSEIIWEQRDNENNRRWIITKESPFYVESGGQVNDNGVVTINDHSYHVIDLKKVGAPFQPAIAVLLKPVETMGECAVGDSAHCLVDKQARINTVKNHTATHMLHAALHEILGKQAKQAGSVVNKDYLRFDYTHHQPLGSDIIKQIEDRVNEKIQENIKTDISVSTLEAAKSKGVIAFFGEKYNPESVRVVSIPGFSNELCGGTHAEQTGIIGTFKIVSDTALATGTRRMVAVTGPKALELFQQTYRDTKQLSEQFKVKIDQVVPAVEKQTEQLNSSLSQIKKLKKASLKAQLSEWASQITDINGIGYHALALDDIDSDGLRQICNALDQKRPGFYFVASNNKEKQKSQFIAWTSSGALSHVDHKALGEFLKSFNLRGGGKPGLIQGGGPLVTREITDAIKQWITAL